MSISCEICGEYNHFTRNCKHGPFNWKNIFGVSNFKNYKANISSIILSNDKYSYFLKYNRLNKFLESTKISVFLYFTYNK